MERSSARVLAALVLLVCLAVAVPASAAFPGRDGTIAVCARPSSGLRSLYSLPPDGSRVARLLPKAGWEDIAPAWSPDGTRIAFVSDRTGDRDVWTIAADGSDAVNLTGTPGLDEWLPTWSPNGRIAFLVQGGAAGDRIDVMDADGGGRATVAAPGARLFGVEWSPLGGRIVYGVATGDAVAIEAIRTDGTHRRRWASGLAHAVVFDWSPDGKRVLFQASARGRLVLSEIETGGDHRIRRLTRPGATSRDQHGAYAPSGDRVVFVRTTSAGDGLWLIRSDRTNQHLLRAFPDKRLFGVSWQAR